MISNDKLNIGKFIICVITLLSIISVVFLTDQIEKVQESIDHATIIKSDPHKYYVNYTRQLQVHRFHWTFKNNSQSDVRSVYQVNSAYFSISPNNQSESIIAKMMMDRLLMPIKLTSTFI